MKKIAIIGSGFLGMTLAKRLADAGARVTLFESGPEIGGLASVWDIGGITWDKHYHVVLASDTHTRNIIEELGLGDGLRWTETKTGFYTDGKLESMSDTVEFLRFPPLGLISKLRLGLTILYASKITDWRRLEQLSVEQWLTKLSGRNTFEKIWKPLLRAKLGEAYRETAASFIWASIQRMYSARKSGMKKEMFGYVRGGYAKVLERFSEALLDAGVEIRLNARVSAIEKQPNGKIRVAREEKRRSRDAKLSVLSRRTKYAQYKAPAVVTAGFSGAFMTEPAIQLGKNARFDQEDTFDTFDRVIVTCPSDTASHMIHGLTPEETKGLTGIRYQGIVCASVLLRSSLSRYYVTNITDDTPFTGIIEMSAVVNKSEFKGNALVYLPRYVAPDDPLFDKSDDEIREIFLNGLAKMYPRFSRSDVLAFKISKVRQVFPIPVLNYSEALSPMKTSVDGVYVVNSSHIVNGTLNINETVHLAERFFEEIKSEMTS